MLKPTTYLNVYDDINSIDELKKHIIGSIRKNFNAFLLIIMLYKLI